MLRFLIVIILALSFVTSQKINEKTVRPSAPVNKTCIQILRRNSSLAEKCEFFKCFEKRFPCGLNYYAMNWAHKYCLKHSDSEFYNKLTQTGQFVADQLNICLPQSFEKIYKQRRSLNCKKFYEHAFKLQTQCYKDIQQKFCEGFAENKNTFLRVIDQNDLMNSLLLNMMQTVVEPCEPKIDLMSIFFQG